MALTDFFRINLPYGISKNENGEWMCYNREYMPLGWNKKNHSIEAKELSYPFEELPIYTAYKGLGEKTLLNLSYKGEASVRRNSNNEIIQVFFYGGDTNPASNAKYWNSYFEKIKLLARCSRKINRLAQF